MNKTLEITIEGLDLIELKRILMDVDTEEALMFLKEHFKGKASEVLKGIYSGSTAAAHVT